MTKRPSKITTPSPWSDTNQAQRTVSKDEAAKVLRRAGITPNQISEILAQLPDPFDLDRDSATLERYGVTRGRLVERMGGSP
jgi:DNA-directed RNA polymerase subunit H (RpoH/RPB5)